MELLRRKGKTPIFSVLHDTRGVPFADKILSSNPYMNPALLAEDRFDMKLDGQQVDCAALADCGTLLMYGSGARLVFMTLRVGTAVDLMPGELQSSMSTVSSCAFCSAWDRSSPTLAVAALAARVLILDLAGARSIRELEAPCEVRACAVAPRAAMSSPELRVAACDATGTLIIWVVQVADRQANSNLPVTMMIPALPSPGSITSGWSSPIFVGATTVAAAATDGVSLWNTSDTTYVSETRRVIVAADSAAERALLLRADLSSSGRLLVVDASACARVWDVQRDAVLCTLSAADGQQQSSVRDACWSRSGRLICTLQGRDELTLFSAHTGVRIHEVRHRGHQFHVCVSLSPDDNDALDTRELWVLGLGTHRSSLEFFAQKLPLLDWHQKCWAVSDEANV